MMAYKTIISATQLTDKIRDPDCLILDCRGQFLGGKKSYDNYLKSHIPKAYFCTFSENYIPTFTDSNSTTHNSILNAETMLDCLTENGFNKHSQIVIYDIDSNSFTDTLWLQLRSLGCRNVAVLQGGFNAWKKQNYLLSTGETVSERQESRNCIN